MLTNVLKFISDRVMPPPFKPLPEEIIDFILSRDTSPQDYLSLSLVSRQFYRPTKPHLYSHLRLYNDRPDGALKVAHLLDVTVSMIEKPAFHLRLVTHSCVYCFYR